jgi:hypothetical protein
VRHFEASREADIRFAKEVLELLTAFPDREWRLGQIVNHVARGRPTSKQARERYRKGVRRVMEALIESKTVEYRPGRTDKSPTLYRWRN